jgi:hypothetical protein
MPTPRNPQKKAAEIEKLRSQGKTDAQIIAADKNLHAGFVWLEENPGQSATGDQPVPAAPAKPRGSGPVARSLQPLGSYGGAVRLPQL